MKFQILIPQYKETDEVVKPLLDSIAIQQNVDMNEIGVIICNDGSDTFLSEELLNNYPYKIEYYKEPHKGVSATRNACLDKATAEYVMFCDADDMFYSVCGLYLIFREINIGGFDSLVSVFIEEGRHPETKEPIYINHDMDMTFVHGKVHRRQYLIDNKIRWNDNLTIHEDSFFNCLCQKCAKELKYCPTPFYLWKWRDDSICRGDFKYILKTYNNMLDSNTALVEELLHRGKGEDAAFFACNMIYDAYYTMNKDEWVNQENIEYREAVEKRFKKYYDRYNALANSLDKQVQSQIIMGQKNRMYGEGLVLEHITFSDWIKHLEEVY